MDSMGKKMPDGLAKYLHLVFYTIGQNLIFNLPQLSPLMHLVSC